MISQNTQNLLKTLPELIDYSEMENKDKLAGFVNTYKKSIQAKDYKEALFVLKGLQDYLQNDLAKQEVKLLRRIVEDIDYSQKRAVELDAELQRIVKLARETSTLVPLINDVKDHLKIIFENTTTHVANTYHEETKLKLKNKQLKEAISGAIVSFLTDVETNAKIYRRQLEKVLAANDAKDKEYNANIKKYVSPRGQAIRTTMSVVASGMLNIGKLKRDLV